MKQAMTPLVYPVKDLAKAKALYAQWLGTAPAYDSPYYVGFKIGEQEIGLDPNGHRAGVTGPVAYLQVPDVKASVQSLQQAGAQVLQDVKDVGGGKLIAILKDADGNPIGITQNP